MPSPERVLVLDGQTTQGLACVRSLGRAGHTVYVASPLRRPLAAWSRYCRAHFRLGDETIVGFAALRAWARTQGVGIVLPQRERSCLLCDAERDQWEAAGIVVGCGREDMLLRAFDKGRTLEHAAACGLRIPPTRPRRRSDTPASSNPGSAISGSAAGFRPTTERATCRTRRRSRLEWPPVVAARRGR